MWDVMFWPCVACVLLPWLLVYLGIHVVQRGIIFIDIAMAQMASLGICVAVLLHLDLQSPATFVIALGFTLVGAVIFSFTGERSSQVPQEALIGIAYVVATAAAVLLLSRAAEGDEEIKNMLVGNILLVSPAEVWQCFGLFAAVGVFHGLLRRQFMLVSFDRDAAYQQGMRVRWWDFLFYASFGLVVTSSVSIAGVLLVFAALLLAEESREARGIAKAAENARASATDNAETLATALEDLITARSGVWRRPGAACPLRGRARS